MRRGRQLFCLESGKRCSTGRSQQHALIAAVRIVTVHAWRLDHRNVLPQFRGFLVAGETDQLLRHGQAQRGHVPLRSRHMAYRTWSRHRRVHGLPGNLLGMTRRTIGVCGNHARMLNAPTRDPGQQEQKKRSEPPFWHKDHMRRAILVGNAC